MSTTSISFQCPALSRFLQGLHPPRRHHHRGSRSLPTLPHFRPAESARASLHSAVPPRCSDPITVRSYCCLVPSTPAFPPTASGLAMMGAGSPRRSAVCALRQAPRRRPAGSAGLAFAFGRGGRRKDDAAALLAQPSAASVALEPVVDAETAALRAAYVFFLFEGRRCVGVWTCCGRGALRIRVRRSFSLLWCFVAVQAAGRRASWRLKCCLATLLYGRC